MLLWCGARCCTSRNAMSLSAGMCAKNCLYASSPPAEAPMPTTSGPESGPSAPDGPRFGSCDAGGFFFTTWSTFSGGCAVPLLACGCRPSSACLLPCRGLRASDAPIPATTDFAGVEPDDGCARFPARCRLVIAITDIRIESLAYAKRIGNASEPLSVLNLSNKNPFVPSAACVASEVEAPLGSVPFDFGASRLRSGRTVI